MAMSEKLHVNAAFDALGLSIRRSMLERLRRGGAMSLSKLSEPYGITLPTAQTHLRALQRGGLVRTVKQGRVRICVYNPQAFRDLAQVLVSQAAFWDSSFARLERHLKSKKRK
jgi:DNA-binding transcriptional ArsR family regulator